MTMIKNEGFVIWLTGLPGSGKTTVARVLRQQLQERGVVTAHLESDHLRTIFTPKPDYSQAERDWFYSILVFLGTLLSVHGVDVLIDATANLRKYRDDMRAAITPFAEIYIRCPLEVCIERDPKGIYAAAYRGKTKTVPGLQEPYEEPEHPEFIVDSNLIPAERAAQEILAHLVTLGWVSL
jgi:adenylylsulfate kinase